MSETYSDVDSSADVAGAVAWQERIDAWPAIESYKHRLDQLCSVRPIVDVGQDRVWTPDGPGRSRWIDHGQWLAEDATWKSRI